MEFKKEIEGLLSEKDVLGICKIVGCGPERVRNKPNYCNFPASQFLTENIHYEAIRHPKGDEICCELHFECDAEDLIKNNIENDKRFVKLDWSKKWNWYSLNTDTDGDIVDKFKNLYNVVNPIIEKYLDDYEKKVQNFLMLSKKIGIYILHIRISSRCFLVV